MTDFAVGVYSFLKQNGLDARELAAEMGVSRTYLSTMLHRDSITEKSKAKVTDGINQLCNKKKGNK